MVAGFSLQKKQYTIPNLDKKILAAVDHLGRASRRAVDREEEQTPFSQQLAYQNKRWVPRSIPRESLSPLQNEVHDLTFRKVRGILNKLTPQKFDKLTYELLRVGIHSQDILAGIILLIFEKALEEPKYSCLYAKLCSRLSKEAPNFDFGNSNSNTFKRLLLNKCQDEFENRRQDKELLEKEGAILNEKEREELSIAKRKMLGNIKFIGELGKLEMVHEGVLHKCIKQLLDKKKQTPIKDIAEDLECLCQIMKTVGHLLDTKVAKPLMNQYFDRIAMLMKNKEMPHRVKFLLQDVIDLRAQNWIPRSSRESGPQTIFNIRQEAIRDGIFVHSDNYLQPSSCAPMNLAPHHRQMKGIVNNIPNSFCNQSTNFEINSTNSNANKHSFLDDKSRNNFGWINRNIVNNPGKPVNSGQRYRQQSVANFEVDRPSISLPSEGPKDRPISVLKPCGPAALPKSAQQPVMYADRTINKLTMPMSHKQGVLTIRQVTNQTVRKTVSSTNDNNQSRLLQDTIQQILDCDYDNVEIFDVVLSKLNEEEQKTVKKFLDQLLVTILMILIDKSDCFGDDRSFTNDNKKRLITAVLDLCRTNCFTNETICNAIKSVIAKINKEQTESMEIIIKICANLLIMNNGSLSLKNIMDIISMNNNCNLFEFVINVFRLTVSLKGNDWLKNYIDTTKFDLKCLLNGVTMNGLICKLDKEKLDFLVPFVRFERQFAKQLSEDVTILDNTSLINWIEENAVDFKENADQFVSIIFKCIIDRVTSTTSLTSDDCIKTIPSKLVCNEEKMFLLKFSNVLRKFIGSDKNYQKVLLYTIQEFAYNKCFPKGLILRLFVHMYEEDIIEEEVFLQWKEEVNDEYPGKGEALFQVNQWLTWLEHAESEDDDSEGIVGDESE